MKLAPLCFIQMCRDAQTMCSIFPNQMLGDMPRAGDFLFIKMLFHTQYISLWTMVSSNGEPRGNTPERQSNKKILIK